jgi:hypothetical protein
VLSRLKLHNHPENSGQRYQSKLLLGEDRTLTDLIGELSTRSDDFRTRWAVHGVEY